MARSIEDIQSTILEAKTKAETLDVLELLTIDERADIITEESNSKVAVWRLWVYIFSFCTYIIETLFDEFSKEVDVRIAQNEIHNFLWYRKKALEFQYGQALVPEKDYYDNSGLSIAEIEARKIIKHVAVDRKIINGHGYLEMKLAREVNGVFVPLEVPQMEAFDAYMFQVADAGTYIEYISLENDDLRLVLDIYYDPLVLYSDGTRKDGTDNMPVINAINEFLYNLEFNGELILAKLTDFMQQIEGVAIPVIKEAYSKFGAFDYTPIDVTYIARSGYARLDQDNTIINYIAREF